MRRLLPLIFHLLIVNIAAAQQTDTGFGKPVFWYSISGAWGNMNDAKGPLFILYESGNVLYWQDGIYRQTELGSQEMETLTDELRLKDTLFSKSRNLDATNDPATPSQIIITDQLAHRIFVNDDTLVKLSVYGHINNPEYKKRYPQAVIDMYQAIIKFSDINSRPWLPGKINLFLQEDDSRGTTPLKWPSGWPVVTHNNTKTQRSYMHLLLDGRKYAALLKLYARQKKKNMPVNINGKNYRINYGLSIPGIN